MDRVLGLPEDEPLPLLLWSALRRVHAWANALPEERAGLWGEGGWCREELAAVKASAPHLAAALDAFAELRERPVEVEAVAVAHGCDQVGRWAAEWGLMPTAVMFMEAAAAADPYNAVRAMDTGLMCQRLGGPGLMERAEQWHQRSLDLARTAKQGRRLLGIRALLAYGNWARDAGDYALARKCYEKASRRAKRWERWLYYAMAHHNLLGLAELTSGDFAGAEAHAYAALEHYPKGHALLPMLVHDYAVLLNRHRSFGSAFRLLENLAPLIDAPEIRLSAHSSLALAAAGIGNRDVFERAMEAALGLCPVYGDFAPYALTRIAEGAAILGMDERSRLLAERASQLALARGDDCAERAARAVLMFGGEGTATAGVENSAAGVTAGLLPQFVALLPQSQPVTRTKKAPSPAVSSDAENRPVRPSPAWPLWGGAESTSGLDVLREVEFAAELPADRSLSLVLWTALRKVHQWIDAMPEQRPALFSNPDGWAREHLLFFRSQIPELRDALSALAALYQAPELIGRAQLAAAFDAVGCWAADSGKLRTAVLFMEAAAKVEPENALRAMDAGLMCQRHGGPKLMARAEEWHQLAFELARTAKKGRRLLAIRALLAYGNWARDAGEYPLAGYCYEKAAGRAWRHKRWKYFAMAHHNLLGLAELTTGDFAGAEAHAQAAWEHYPKGNARLPRLIHDYAVLLNRHRFYGPAFRLLENLAPLIEEPAIRLSAHSSLALAAAGIGRRDLFDRSAEDAVPLCPLYGDFAAHAFLRLAEGALLCRDFDRAVAFASEALESAKSRSDDEAADAAMRLRGAAEMKQPAAREADAPAESRVEQLQRAFRLHLQKLATRRHGTAYKPAPLVRGTAVS